MTFDPKHNSRTITDGRDPGAPRARYLYGIGFTREDLAKPIVGIANTWIGTMPCNFNLRLLAEKVAEGVRKAGGTPMEFNTIAISDGITMGTEGMKTSLVSRELIADSIELCTRGYMFDALVCLVGCDKTIPAASMALARLNIPGIIVYGGSILPGRYKGQRRERSRTCSRRVGANAAGTMSDEELDALEHAACPGPGACGGQFTANTMALAMEFIGLSPMGSASVPAVDPRKDDVGRARGRDGDGRAAPQRAAARHPHAGGVRERDRRRGGDGRLDERRAAPAGARARGRRAADDRRLRHREHAHAAASPTCEPGGRYVAADLDKRRRHAARREAARRGRVRSTASR